MLKVTEVPEQKLIFFEKKRGEAGAYEAKNVLTVSDVLSFIGKMLGN